MQLGRDSGFALGVQVRSRRQRLQIVGEREILDFLQQRLERGGLSRQLVVIPRGSRVRRQGQHIGQVDAGIELRLVDAVVEVQNLRQKNDAIEVQGLFAL